MFRLILVAAISCAAHPVFAQNEKEVSCGHQADVAAAIVQARLDGVSEKDLPEALGKVATWPDNYTSVLVPIFAPFIYEQKRRDLRKSDSRASTFDQCMSLN